MYKDKSNNKIKNKLVKAFCNMHLQYHINIVLKMHIAFTRNYFAEKKILKKILNFQGVANIFTGGIVKK